MRVTVSPLLLLALVFVLLSDSLCAQVLPTTSLTAKVKTPRKKIVVTTQIVGAEKGTVRPQGTLTLRKPKNVKIEIRPEVGYKAIVIINEKIKVRQKDNELLAAARKPKKGQKTIFVTARGGSKPVKIAAVPITRLLKNVRADTGIKIVFAPFGAEYSLGSALSLIGLGSSVTTTNSNPGHFEGNADSPVGVKSVAWQNITTGGFGAARGTRSFSADVPLVEGDNKLRFSLRAADNVEYSLFTTVTHSASSDFLTPLNVSRDLVFIGDKADLIFRIALATRGTAVATLLSCDKDGNITSELTQPLTDRGVLPDEIDSDGVYTGLVSVAPTEPAVQCYRIMVERDGVKYLSGIRNVRFAAPVTSDELSALTAIGQKAKQRMEVLVAGGLAEDQAAKVVAEELKSDPEVKHAGTSSDGGVWWITKGGLLGGQFPKSKPGYWGGGESSSDERERYRKLQYELPLAPLEGTFTPSTSRHEPAANAVDDQLHSDVDSASYPISIRSAGTVAERKQDRIKSPFAALVSPFMANPHWAGPSIGADDSYFGPWQYIRSVSSECSFKAESEAIINGISTITLQDFTRLGKFGLVHISTHGRIFNSETDRTWWDPAWGAEGELSDLNGTVVLESGLRLRKTQDGKFDPEPYAVSIRARQLLITSDGDIALLPSYFRQNLEPLPKSLILLTVCNGMHDSRFANVFIEKGAGAVLGFDGLVTAAYSNGIIQPILQEMVEHDSTLIKALENATSVNPPPGIDFVKIRGLTSIRAPLGELENGDFEDMSLVPWTSSGDGRVVGGLGGFGPVHGNRTAIISTGLGYTTDSGEIEQKFCLPGSASHLSLSWNFFSEEFKEYCGSRYQDWFDITLCTRARTDPEDAEVCGEALHVTIDSLCEGVAKTGLTFDVGDLGGSGQPDGASDGVYTTGWRSLQLPLESVRGKVARLKLSAHDIGDSAYDSAILIDNIKVHEIEDG